MSLDLRPRITVSLSEGWAKPSNAAKTHYFVDGVSLCGAWGYHGSLIQGFATDTDCAACRKASLGRSGAYPAPSHLRILH